MCGVGLLQTRTRHTRHGKDTRTATQRDEPSWRAAKPGIQPDPTQQGPWGEEHPPGQRVKPAQPLEALGNSLLPQEFGVPALQTPLPALLPLEKLTMPSSTTKVGMAPLPCSIDTTLSWEQFLRAQQSPLRALRTHSCPRLSWKILLVLLRARGVGAQL